MGLDITLSRVQLTTVFDTNITHNLGRMASEADIYMHLWRPEEIGITQAKDLIAPLTDGLAKLEANPTHFKQFDAKNGWGTYEHFVPFVRGYLNACKAYPDATITASR